MELILNITVFFVSVWGRQYEGELILNVTVFVVRTGQCNIERN